MLQIVFFLSVITDASILSILGGLARKPFNVLKSNSLHF